VQLHNLFTRRQGVFGEEALQRINYGESPKIMGLFTPDLFRSLAIGFALGAVVVFATLGGSAGSDLAKGVVPTAIAAPVK
jgi:hypothetical protein